MRPSRNLIRCSSGSRAISGCADECDLPAARGGLAEARTLPAPPVRQSVWILFGSTCYGASLTKSCNCWPRPTRIFKRAHGCHSMTMSIMSCRSIAGSCASGRNDLEDAIADLKSAIERKAAGLPGVRQPGPSLSPAGQSGPGSRTVGRAVELEPGWPTFTAYGWLRLERNESDLALGDFDQGDPLPREHELAVSGRRPCRTWPSLATCREVRPGT